MIGRLATIAAGLVGAAAAHAASCDGIGRLALPADLRIVHATPIEPAQHFVPPMPGIDPVPVAFCRIEGVIEKEIGFELWLPEHAAWSGRFLAGGVGGQAGQFNYRELARGVRRGYASASTDTGHKAADFHWLLGDPARAANYAERANHLLAVKAKALVAAYYARPIRTALFVGCSGGGRQAMTEAERFPADYDGILAGAPGVNTPEMSARRMWEMVQHSAAAGIMTDAAWAAIQVAAIAACDGRDGVIDGVVEDGGSCRFPIRRLACARAPGAGCLSDAQVAIAERLYAPLKDEQGRIVDSGILPVVRIRPQPMPEPFTPGPPYLAVALFGDGVHRDPNWDARTFRIADDLPAVDRVMDLHADDPDLRPFVARGGKLILYQGWADPLVAAQPTVACYRAVRTAVGPAAADRAVRLYMVPGMEHCVGGGVADQFGGAGGDAPIADAGHDMLSALEAWVERDVAPGPIVAAKVVARRVVQTHPLCPFPQRANYAGHGGADDAASFACRLPPHTSRKGQG